MFEYKNRHLPILKSYIADPVSHAEACKDPKMTGGPFIDFEGGRVPEVKKLLVNTLQKQSHLISFAAALEKLDKLLLSEAKGYSLEVLYEKVPEILKGYVELVYDLHNNPSYRLREALLYNSKFYDKSIQSLLMYQIHDDDRPFVFSTPRLKREQSISLDIPFDHPGIDELFSMLRTPQTLSYIKEKLEIAEEDEKVFESFFTTEKPAAYKNTQVMQLE